MSREVPHQTEPGASLHDCGGYEGDRVLVRLGRGLALQCRSHQGEERPVTDDRGGVTFHLLRDVLEAFTTSDRSPLQRFLARGDEVKVRPCSLFQSRVLGLWDSGFIRGPFLQARALRDGPSKCTCEDDGGLDAPPQGAREDGRRRVRGPRATEGTDLVLPSFRERRAVEIRRVRRADNFAVADEDERRGHAETPPDTTPITRIRSPSLKPSSAGIGPSPRIKMCASGASRRARSRSTPLAAGPNSTDSSLRPGRISAVTCIRSSRTLPDLSVLPRAQTSEHLSEPSVSG